MTKGKVIQYRRGRHNTYKNQFILEIEGVSGKDNAEKFVGKEVVWSSPKGKEIKGKISNPHGNAGLVRAIFEKGLPGQALTTEVKIS